MDKLSFDTLTCEIVDEHIAIVRLDNPPVNAHSAQMLEDLPRMFDGISDSDEIRAVILTGEGRVFCAGADLKARSGQARQAGDHWRSSRTARECYHSIRECTKPVIAALNSVALGGGLAIATSCDILMAAEKASLGLPEIDVGLLGGQSHAQRLFSHSRLRTMALTGERISGPELYRTAIVEACVPGEELLPTALDMARRLAAKSPIAMRMAKGSLNMMKNLVCEMATVTNKISPVNWVKLKIRRRRCGRLQKSASPYSKAANTLLISGMPSFYRIEKLRLADYTGVSSITDRGCTYVN